MKIMNKAITTFPLKYRKDFDTGKYLRNYTATSFFCWMSNFSIRTSRISIIVENIFLKKILEDPKPTVEFPKMIQLVK